MHQTLTPQTGQRLAVDEFLTTSALYLGLASPLRNRPSGHSGVSPRLVRSLASVTKTGARQPPQP